jgi:hypothetical protein
MRLVGIAIAMAIPLVAQAADLDAIAPSEHVGRIASGGDYYLGRGVYQDSGWAYEVPVYRDGRDCRVRITQTPSGVDRLRSCHAVVGRSY